jgi:threonine aldolase
MINMENVPIDLRSDTVTKPSEGMREAMARAAVGDDVYGEDPTINRLEEMCAEISQKETALFVPSGSMANLIAQMCYIQKGDEVIIGEDSHCFRYEVGAGAAIAGSQYVVIEGSGLFTAEQARERIRPPTFHTPGTALLWIENTHNMGGGIVFPLEEIKRLKALAAEHGLPLHMDGARVFNASVATSTPVGDITRHVDSVSFCFSKGLGAPVGSALCCSRDMRTMAHRFRKMLGGGMRQAGVLAAAAVYALENNFERLAEDHENAARLARSISAMPGIEVDLDSVQTNIIMARLPVISADDVVEELRQRGVLINSVTPDTIRLVTHLDVSAGDMDRASSIIEQTLSELAG